MITAQGKIIRMDVGGISRIGRATQGVRLIQIDEGDEVVAAIRTAEREEEGKPSPWPPRPTGRGAVGPETRPEDDASVEDEAEGPTRTTNHEVLHRYREHQARSARPPSLGILDGVTTNPCLVAKEGRTSTTSLRGDREPSSTARSPPR